MKKLHEPSISKYDMYSLNRTTDQSLFWVIDVSKIFLTRRKMGRQKTKLSCTRMIQYKYKLGIFFLQKLSLMRVFAYPNYLLSRVRLRDESFWCPTFIYCRSSLSFHLQRLEFKNVSFLDFEHILCVIKKSYKNT